MTNGDGTGQARLERVTVNLVPRAAEALDRIMELTGDSKTDSINRALKVLDVLERRFSEGGELVVRYEHREAEVLKFL